MQVPYRSTPIGRISRGEHVNRIMAHGALE